MKNITLAIVAATCEMPVKPNNPAMIDIRSNKRASFNI
jgi:hypothetical protein